MTVRLAFLYAALSDRKKTIADLHRHLEERGQSTTRRTVERHLRELERVGLARCDGHQPAGWRRP
jgi:repressor of nif and glnA expression